MRDFDRRSRPVSEDDDVRRVRSRIHVDQDLDVVAEVLSEKDLAYFAKGFRINFIASAFPLLRRCPVAPQHNNGHHRGQDRSLRPAGTHSTHCAPGLCFAPIQAAHLNSLAKTKTKSCGTRDAQWISCREKPLGAQV